MHINEESIIIKKEVYNMKTAIIYYSMSGNTEYVAEKIGKQIGAALVRIEPEKAYPDYGAKKFIWGGKSAVMGDTPKLKPYEFNADDYERIIFGFPVWASTFTPPIRTFIQENKDAIKNKKFAAFTCLAGNGGENALDKLKKFLDISAFEAELILIDPKEKQSAENDKKIEDFCGGLA